MQPHVDSTAAASFLPHGYCYLWNTPLLVTHVAADLLIGGAYVAISVALGVLVHRLRADIPFSAVFVAFGLFIIACGFTHFIEVWTLWVPVYWLAGTVKAVTAAASVTTAIAMPFTVPKVIGTVREAGLARARELQVARADALEAQNAQLTALTSELSTVNAQLREALTVAEQERARADAANRVKGDFLRTMSHELRTPLNAIGGYVDLLELEIRGPVTEAQRNDLHRIRRAQLHLLGIITDILTYARIEAGALEYRVERVPLASVVEDVALLIRPQIAAKGQELEVALVQPEKLIARADAAKLSQVLLNLLSNAHKYTPAGGRILLHAVHRAGRVLVRVADTGPGIPHDRYDAVFEPFVQAVGGLARPFDGTGLGLAISRDMVRAMRGELRIDDEEARRELGAQGFRGAVFLVDLPAFTPETSRPPDVGAP